MANDCLVTKLKGVVNNNSLPRFGNLLFILAARDGFSVTPYFQINGITKATIEGDAYFTNSAGTDNLGQELTTFTDNKFYIKNITEGDLLFVEVKYNFTSILLLKITAIDLIV